MTRPSPICILPRPWRPHAEATIACCSMVPVRGRCCLNAPFACGRTGKRSCARSSISRSVCQMSIRRALRSAAGALAATSRPAPPLPTSACRLHRRSGTVEYRRWFSRCRHQTWRDAGSGRRSWCDRSSAARAPRADDLQQPQLKWSVVQRGFWVDGVSDLRAYLRSVEQFTMEGRAELIRCPMLLTLAENDPLATNTRRSSMRCAVRRR